MNERRLYLSRDKIIAGVAGGVAEYFRIDPTIVRLLWAFAAFTGAGIVVYIIAMFIMPERPRSETVTPSPGGAMSHDEVEVKDEVKDEAIEDLKKAARDLAESSGEVAQDVAERVRRSVEKLKASERHSEVQSDSPSGPGSSEPVQGNDSKRNLGIILLLAGLFFLFRSVVPWFPSAIIWPLILIFLGVVFLLKGVGDR